MARLGVQITMVMVLATMLWTEAMAQSSSSCTNVLLTMSPCLNYITRNFSAPSSGSCTQLASVVRSQPKCLCEVLNGGGSSLRVSINKTRALELLSACNVQTPSISQCSGRSGTKTVLTSEAGGSSGGRSNKLSFTMLFALVFFVSYVSTFIHF